MKKILILTHEFPPFLGGIGTYASQLALAAHEIGHDITVVAPDFDQDCLTHDSEQYPFEVSRYKGGHYSYKKLPSLVWRTWRQIRTNDFDLVHAVDIPFVMALALLNKLRDVPFMATCHGTELLSMLYSRQVRGLRLSNMFELPFRIVTNSEFTKTLVYEHVPSFDRERVDVTYLGVDQSWFRACERDRSVLERFGVTEGNKVVLTVARLDDRKGHRLVLRAIARLAPEIKQQLSYLIVGSGGVESYKTELRKLADRCGAQVLFTGGISDGDLHSLYAASHIYCMPGEPNPKKVEGFGLVYLEAAAQGLPSIAADVGAVSEVVVHGETGLMIKPLDVDAMTQALSRLLVDEAYRGALGEMAKDRAREFTWRRCAEQTYGVV